MSGESVVSSAVPAAATRTTSFKGTSPSSKYVKLNVGGALYYTTMQTLTKQDTMLKAMFSGRMEVLTDSEGKPSVLGRGCASCRGLPSSSEEQHKTGSGFLLCSVLPDVEGALSVSNGDHVYPGCGQGGLP